MVQFRGSPPFLGGAFSPTARDVGICRGILLVSCVCSLVHLICRTALLQEVPAAVCRGLHNPCRCGDEGLLRTHSSRLLQLSASWWRVTCAYDADPKVCPGRGLPCGSRFPCAFTYPLCWVPLRDNMCAAFTIHPCACPAMQCTLCTTHTTARRVHWGGFRLDPVVRRAFLSSVAGSVEAFWCSLVNVNNGLANCYMYLPEQYPSRDLGACTCTAVQSAHMQSLSDIQTWPAVSMQRLRLAQSANQYNHGTIRFAKACLRAQAAHQPAPTHIQPLFCHVT